MFRRHLIAVLVNMACHQIGQDWREAQERQRWLDRDKRPDV